MENDWLKRIKETNSIVHDNIVSLDILLDDNSISHVGIREREIVVYGCRTKIGSIGGVATKEEYRNHGLATRLMESSIRRIDEDEGDVMYVSGGRGLYRRLGCVDAGEVREFIISRSDSAILREQKIELSPYKENDIVKLVAAYQKEPVRFHRPLENFKFNLRRHPVPLWITPDVLLMEKDGEFLGYLVIQESRKKEGREPGHGYISEYAGDRRAVVSAIPTLFEQYDFNDLTIWAPRHDTELIQMLSEQGLKSRKSNLRGHTFKLTNFPRLMKRFRPYVEERVGTKIADSLEFKQVGDNFSIKLDDEQFSTDGVSAVLIVFGSCDGREREFMPKSGKIAEALEVIFPLPFIWPGLDSC
ncbi:GNAT family N-acetyltransferase [Candidatus Poribacteria bacterium]|nr:GNAT family N-acetyltransferase [Candidatus Poribacteria bacterium]